MQREAALIQEIDTLRGELKAYQSREAEWNRANQERQQIDITERKQADVEIKKQLNKPKEGMNNGQIKKANTQSADRHPRTG